MWEFPKPWGIEVNPFGKSEDGVDNIFIIAADGSVICTINKHPVWKYMQNKRLELAQRLVDCVNKNQL